MDKHKKEHHVFVVKKNNVNTTMFPSQTNPGAVISTAWKISKNRCEPGSRVYFVHDWSSDSFQQGIVTAKYRQGSGLDARFNIEFMPDDVQLKYEIYKGLPRGQEKAYWSNEDLTPKVENKSPYLHRINTVKGFEMLSSQEANDIKNVMLNGFMPRNGIRYPDNTNDIVVLNSDSDADLLDAMKKGHWTHNHRPAQAQPGWTVYVICNKNRSIELGSYIAIKGQITEVVTLEQEDTEWSSVKQTVN